MATFDLQEYLRSSRRRVSHLRSLKGRIMGTLQGPVICPFLLAKQVGVHAMLVNGCLLKAEILRNGFWGCKPIFARRTDARILANGFHVQRRFSFRCTFSSSSNGNSSRAENFSDSDEDYVNSSVVEAVEVKSASDGFTVKMRDGRFLKCVHNNRQGGHLPDYAPHPAIVLKMEDGTGLLLPIIVLEMPSVLLMAAIRNLHIARPTMYQVVKEMVEKMGYAVKLVRVTRRVHEAYFARIYLSKVDNESESISFDVRPSDAINIAVRCKVPIQVNRYLVYSDGMRIVDSSKPQTLGPASDGSLSTIWDRPRTLSRCCSMEGQTHSTSGKKELDMTVARKQLCT
ncbi:hypothetical protein Nepgr_006012 [Nepenthes gracilis]|uniref:BFN domain-containing protein n=1 Tax=Nepenthes gracilis TaxID=150966 RepID=A0AAD3S4E0_NEPGR|nr:hypothetical protein Nepgr_006012 [Nepenthes gracilis]